MISKKLLLFAITCTIVMGIPVITNVDATTEPKTKHDLWKTCNDTFGSGFLSDFFCGVEPPEEQGIIR